MGFRYEALDQAFFLDGFLALACYSNSGKPEFWIFGPEFFQLRPEFSGQKRVNLGNFCQFWERFQLKIAEKLSFRANLTWVWVKTWVFLGPEFSSKRPKKSLCISTISPRPDFLTPHLAFHMRWIWKVHNFSVNSGKILPILVKLQLIVARITPIWVEIPWVLVRIPWVLMKTWVLSGPEFWAKRTKTSLY